MTKSRSKTKIPAIAHWSIEEQLEFVRRCNEWHENDVAVSYGVTRSTVTSYKAYCRKKGIGDLPKKSNANIKPKYQPAEYLFRMRDGTSGRLSGDPDLAACEAAQIEADPDTLAIRRVA